MVFVPLLSSESTATDLGWEYPISEVKLRRHLEAPPGNLVGETTIAGCGISDGQRGTSDDECTNRSFVRSLQHQEEKALMGVFVADPFMRSAACIIGYLTEGSAQSNQVQCVFEESSE